MHTYFTNIHLTAAMYKLNSQISTLWSINISTTIFPWWQTIKKSLLYLSLGFLYLLNFNPKLWMCVQLVSHIAGRSGTHSIFDHILYKSPCVHILAGHNLLWHPCIFYRALTHPPVIQNLQLACLKIFSTCTLFNIMCSPPPPGHQRLLGKYVLVLLRSMFDFVKYI